MYAPTPFKVSRLPFNSFWRLRLSTHTPALDLPRERHTSTFKMASLTVMEWAREELIPLLNFVWVKPPVGSWDVRIQDISETIQSLVSTSYWFNGLPEIFY
tara:strand:+ start:7436 stop:7738 length:303 start_codon:yes stop_codon:yes gene_type:complete